MAILLVVAACGQTPQPSPSASRSAAPSASQPSATSTPSASDPCAVAAQQPPPATISADFPTALAFAPDGRLFYAERAGTLRVWQSGAAHTFATVNTSTSGERGLLGLALSPSFSRDHLVYAFYSDANGSDQHVIRWRDCAGVASAATILVTLPAGGDCCHKGGRLAFGADGDLYVTVGEEHVASAAQDTSDVRGKVLRYRPDGGIPADNPFGASNPVWAYGLRNPFGIAFAPSGALALTVNGPTGDVGSPSTGYDILIENVARGSGHQWPLCYGYSHPLQQSGCGGQPGPDWSSEASTYVPTGMTFVDAKAPAPYTSHLVFCSLDRGMQIVTPGAPHATVTQGPATCQLDVKQGPDHALYVASTTAIHRLT